MCGCIISVWFVLLVVYVFFCSVLCVLINFMFCLDSSSLSGYFYGCSRFVFCGFAFFVVGLLFGFSLSLF